MNDITPFYAVGIYAFILLVSYLRRNRDGGSAFATLLALALLIAALGVATWLDVRGTIAMEWL
jgi:hypothetical protein